MADLPRLDHIELQTQNLVLRPPIDADAPDSLLLLQDPDVVQWHPAPAVVDEESARAWCRRGADWSSGEYAVFTIVDAATRRLAGSLVLSHIDQLDQHDAAVGYRVASWARRQGVASGAVEVLTSWAYTSLQVERIRLQHAVPNHASCRVAVRTGYSMEGVMRAGFRDEQGVRHDEHLHARLATD